VLLAATKPDTDDTYCEYYHAAVLVSPTTGRVVSSTPWVGAGEDLKTSTDWECGLNNDGSDYGGGT
jgi:hypothetical protein